ncbi:DNA repair protein RecO [Fructobacillus sp. M1-13]|uniref:DNA repair protein RecO n=1 Tax=Fructobacillus papyriferae TaxID=2713171 RepID=A0ABS5QQU8_9LACO|nr:DNA repair protein RecO [Fructobacillus papyriferae]MBS9334709.1 DNA repair protein RecO [Fructobacillus papyriferae]MCD2158699.1 DNA repair protein RecO [Fructobacillus papyriferae]
MALIEGLILSTTDYRENDLLVKLFTKEAGIITAMARGAKKQKSKLAPVSQSYTWVVVDGVYPKNQQGLGFINSLQESKIYKNVVTDLTTSAYAALIAKDLTVAFDENVKQVDWYERTLAIFDQLNRKKDPQVVANIVELQLLPVFGVSPNWQRDPLSGKEVGDFDYSDKYNGIIEQAHFDMDDHRLHLDQKTVYYLRLFSSIDIRKLGSVTLSVPTKRAVQRVVDYLYDRQVGFQPKEKRFIQKMAAFEGQLSIKPRKKEND